MHGMCAVSLAISRQRINAKRLDCLRHASGVCFRMRAFCSTQARSTWRQQNPKQPSAGQRRSAVGFGKESTVDQSAHLSVLPPGLDLGGKKPRAHWNAVALAFLGDSIWELYARRRHFAPPRRLSEYCASVTDDVRAEAQGIHYDSLKAGAFLTEEELDVLRWGHSAKVTVPKRFSPNGAHTDTYRKSTAMECLVAYLYLTSPSRLHQLMVELRLA